MTLLFNSVIQTIEKHRMIKMKDHIIVGVSGGADSICLLHILNSIKNKYMLKLTAVHINHGIRGKEADSDENYVKEFCNKLNINFETFNCKVKDEAKKLGMTEEEAGRYIRYKKFNEVLKKYKADKIAIAHNMNDNAETLLMRLFRGTGIKGLSGISAVRDNIIRPLLYCSREQIEEYCKTNNIKYCNDYTNNIELYTRNKIRIKLIPWIKENFNNNIIALLSKTSLIMSEENAYLDKTAANALKECLYKDKLNELNLSKLKEYDKVIIRRIIRLACIQYNSSLHDISFEHVNMIMELINKDTGKSVNLPKGLMAEKCYDRLILNNEIKKTNEFDYIIEENKTINIKEINKKLLFSKNIMNDISDNVYTISFDCDKINTVLHLRNKRPGDKIYLKGINGNKKLKNLFIDLKIPRYERENIPVLASENNILWIMGIKVSDAYISNDKTKDKIYLQIWEEQSNERNNQRSYS